MKPVKYVPIKTWIPFNLLERLSNVSKSVNIPIGRLIAHAADLEMDKPKPFDLDLEPKSFYIPNAYADEAQKIIEAMRAIIVPVAPVTLLITRDSFGVPNRETFKLALRELLETDMVEWVDFKFPDGTPTKALRIKKQKFKKSNLAEEIEKCLKKT